MSLNPPVPGLRRIHHDSVGAEKVQIVIAADDTLDVSDDVAEQLLKHSPQFKEAKPAKVPAKKATAKKSAAKSED